jgi:putative oxidoreductase
MNSTSINSTESKSQLAITDRRAQTFKRLAILYGRFALGAAFLSGIADRFGLYTGRNVGYGNFAGFVDYTAKVNSFMPASTIPVLAWAATAAELSLGVALILGIWPRWVALGSAILLVLFGSAMAVSFGIKSPMDYSVFSASAAAVLLAVNSSGSNQEQRMNRREIIGATISTRTEKGELR